MKLIVFTLILFIPVSFISYSRTIKSTFLNEINSEFNNTRISNDIFTQNEISTLPDPIKRYLSYSGFVGRKKMANAKIVFEDVDFKRGLEKQSPMKLTSIQYNFVDNPSRIVYLHSRIMGLIPFEGRDKYQNGQGAMTGKLLKFIPLFDVKDSNMKQSALVTFLSETPIIPSAFFKDYINFETIDKNNVKIIMTHRGLTVSGILTINDDGKITKFYTEDRYMDQGDGKAKKNPWTAKFLEYKNLNGIKTPSRIQGIWNLKDQDFVYFDGYISELKYNVKKGDK
ncbi:MAG: DUF6544 family protein [Fusobacteriota bacterium]